MAGGRDWFLERKGGGYVAYTEGSGSTVKHWRRLEILLTISREEPEDQVDLGPGDEGQVSQVVVCVVGTKKQSTRKAPESGSFLCAGDDSEAMERPTGFFKRTQVWKFVGATQQYDPKTGAVIT